MRRNLKAHFLFLHTVFVPQRTSIHISPAVKHHGHLFQHTDTVAALWEVITIVLVLWCWDSNHNPLIRSTRWPLGHRLQTLSSFPQVISQWTPSLGPFTCKSVKWCWTKIWSDDSHKQLQKLLLKPIRLCCVFFQFDWSLASSGAKRLAYCSYSLETSNADDRGMKSFCFNPYFRTAYRTRVVEPAVQGCLSATTTRLFPVRALCIETANLPGLSGGEQWLWQLEQAHLHLYAGIISK